MTNDTPKADPIASAPVWISLGFRPFFIFAAPFAAFSILLWLHRLSGGGAATDYLPGPLWHAHEMVFGFVGAVVAGFLLTAARNWTKRPTLHGAPLAVLVAIWFAGRVAMVVNGLPGPIVAVVSVAFPLGLTIALARALVRASSHRNYKVIAVLAALTVASLIVHLDANGVLSNLARPAIHAAVHLMVILVAIIAGRIVPMFTRNRLSIKTSNLAGVDRLAIGGSVVVATLAVWSHTEWSTLVPGDPLSSTYALAALATGGLHFTRMRTWGTMPALRVPMLAVLHVGYLWIGAGYVLLGLSVADPTVSMTVALHALNIGGIGMMIIGMMARVGLGHTGRKIAAPRAITVAFVLVCAAALARLAAIVVPPQNLVYTWYLSGALFALAFVTYALSMSRALVTKRPDGRPG